VTSVDLNILVEDAVDALVRIADAVTKDVGNTVRLETENDELRAEIMRLKEEA
jgi:hypothetical protein